MEGEVYIFTIIDTDIINLHGNCYPHLIIRYNDMLEIYLGLIVSTKFDRVVFSQNEKHQIRNIN
jgi:hypothetical protein